MEKFDYKKHFPKAAKVAQEEMSPHKVVLNGQDYLLSVWLESQTDLMEIPNGSIVSLELEDNFIGFSQKGEFTYSTPNYSVENFLSKVGDVAGFECKNDVNTKIEESNNSQFVFQGTGTERIHIKFKTLPNKDNKDNSEKLHSDLIMQTFIITKVDDSGGSLSEKKIRLEFEGIESHVLKNARLDSYTCGDASRNSFTTIKDRYPLDGDWVNRHEFTADKTGEAIYYNIIRAYDDWSKKIGVTHSLINLMPKVKTNGLLLDVDNTTGTVVKDIESTSSGSLIEILADTTIKKDGEETGSQFFRNFNYSLDVSEQSNSLFKYKENVGDIKSFRKDSTDIWDFGSDSSFLFTQSSSNTNTWSIVNKFLNVHTSSVSNSNVGFFDKFVNNVNEIASGNRNVKEPSLEQYHPCVLKLERSVDEDTMPIVTLRPLTSYFKNLKIFGTNKEVTRGGNWIGTFTFDTSEDLGNPLQTIPRFLKNIFCDDETQTDHSIKNFFFEPTRPSDASMIFKSHSSQYTGDKTSTFLNAVDGDFDNVKEYIGLNYVKPLYEYENIITTYGELVNVHNNGLKTVDNILLSNYTNPPTKEASVAVGRNRAVFTFMFMNDALSFTHEGRIGVQSGMFFYADTIHRDKKNKVINRITGGYMCARVTHKINPNGKSYVQDIMGVKFYRNPMKDELITDPKAIDARIDPSNVIPKNGIFPSKDGIPVDGRFPSNGGGTAV